MGAFITRNSRKNLRKREKERIGWVGKDVVPLPRPPHENHKNQLNAPKGGQGRRWVNLRLVFSHESKPDHLPSESDFDQLRVSPIKNKGMYFKTYYCTIKSQIHSNNLQYNTLTN